MSDDSITNDAAEVPVERARKDAERDRRRHLSKLNTKRIALGPAPLTEEQRQRPSAISEDTEFDAAEMSNRPIRLRPLRVNPTYAELLSGGPRIWQALPVRVT